MQDLGSQVGHARDGHSIFCVPHIGRALQKQVSPMLLHRDSRHAVQRSGLRSSVLCVVPRLRDFNSRECLASQVCHHDEVLFMFLCQGRGFSHNHGALDFLNARRVSRNPKLVR